ncbi:MAG: GNAT family N-acetyltransferase [Muribaculaceae bacterium]
MKQTEAPIIRDATIPEIYLRPWNANDSQRLYELASDPDVGPRAGWSPHVNDLESLFIIVNVFINPTTWAIVLNDTDELVGAMGYGPSCDCALPSRHDEPTVGYWVGKPYWNRGLCTLALKMMIGYIKRHTTIASLISGHFEDNPASGRVMEKCGFTATGETVVDPRLYQGEDHNIRVLRLEIQR